MSSFELITITFSLILGLGVAQVLQAVAYVARERHQCRLHWIPLSMAALVLAFQIQFWFALFVVDGLIGQWNWIVYSILLLLAIIIFLCGATVLPSSGSTRATDLLEDFNERGRVSLLFFATYFLGWIIMAVMYWGPRMGRLTVANLLMAGLSVAAYRVNHPGLRAVLHGLLVLLAVFGLITVWATPSLDW